MQYENRFGKSSIYLLLSLMLMLIATSVYAQTAEEEFSRAQQLFNKGEYQQALKGFQHAQELGIKGPAIEYNLGVTHYKLGNYRQARQHFSRLVEDKGMRPLAAYNLGLVYDKLGQHDEAIKWLRVSYEEAGNRKLKTLAWRALGQLGVKVAKPFKPGLSGMAGLFYGSDSNVIDPVNPTSNISDTFTELYAAAFYDMTPSLKLNGFFLNEDYAVANTYDFNLVNLGLEKSFITGKWEDSAELMYTTSNLGGQSYQDSVGGQVEGKLAISDAHDLRLRYRYEQISSTTRPYLQGTRQKIRVERIDRNNFGNRLMYELEMNDRANSASSSYSPTRHTLRYYRYYRLSQNWRADGYVGYRTSTYSTVNATTRSDQRIRLKARIRQYIGKSFQVVAEYSYSNNQSNLTAYSYSRNVVSLGVKASF
jgi:hypothetical protein